MFFILNLIIIFSIHYLIHYNLPEKIRWYANHAISNGIIVTATYKDSIRLLFCESECQNLKPHGGIPYSWSGYDDIELIMVSNMLILHGYHIYFFDNLRLIDYLHHYLMMFIIMIAYFMNSGVYMSYFLFFICGLPGMIDYSVLALEADRKEEKRINTYLNNYIRSPGIIFGMGLMWKDTFHINNLYILLSYTVLYWNSQYFNYSIISNYYSK
jgi:hypothetical protein